MTALKIIKRNPTSSTIYWYCNLGMNVIATTYFEPLSIAIREPYWNITNQLRQDNKKGE